MNAVDYEWDSYPDLGEQWEPIWDPQEYILWVEEADKPPKAQKEKENAPEPEQEQTDIGYLVPEDPELLNAHIGCIDCSAEPWQTVSAGDRRALKPKAQPPAKKDRHAKPASRFQVLAQTAGVPMATGGATGSGRSAGAGEAAGGVHCENLDARKGSKSQICRMLIWSRF